MDTRVLPIGRTYTGSNRAAAAASAPARMQVPARVHTPVPVPAPVQAPVTYGNAAPVVVYQQIAPTNSSAVVSLVLSLVSFVSSIFGLGFVGIIFGHVARSQIKRRGERGNGLAVAGLWLGYLSVIFWVLFWLLYFGVIALVIGLAFAAESGTIS